VRDFFIRAIVGILIILAITDIINSLLSISTDLSTRMVIATFFGVLLGSFLTWLNKL
jgi:hypothetical protein